MMMLRSLSHTAALAGAAISQFADAVQVRVERAVQSPSCPRCGDMLDVLEQVAGRCYDCDVAAIANGEPVYVHTRGVTELVRVA